jgi:hypothetical protein
MKKKRKIKTRGSGNKQWKIKVSKFKSMQAKRRKR